MFYAYCLVEDRVEIAEGVSGLTGAVIESIENYGLVALVSEFGGDTVPIKRENVMTHDAVVGSVLMTSTPLPFRFGTLSTSEQMVNFLASRRSALKAKFEEVRDCVEMSVKVIWTPAQVDSAVSDVIDQTADPGALFLRAKRREILGDEALVHAAKQLNSWLHDKVSHFVRAQEITVRPSQKLVLAASHLVERSQIAAYQQVVKDAVADRRDLHFLTSGPWAPYSFVNIDLEFKTQFGVS